MSRRGKRVRVGRLYSRYATPSHDFWDERTRCRQPTQCFHRDKVNACENLSRRRVLLMSPHPSTSPTLFGKLALNLPGAWERFVAIYVPVIDRHCARTGLQPADVDEVRSRLLLRFTQAMKDFQYDPQHRFRGYLKTCVLNAVRDYWRERNLRPGAVGYGMQTDVEHEVPVAFLELAEEIDDGVTGDLSHLERAIEIVRGMVEPTTWQAFWMATVDEIPANEVAMKIGRSVGAVYMAKSRVLRHLHDVITSLPEFQSVRRKR